jgi:hypothetical protein
MLLLRRFRLHMSRRGYIFIALALASAFIFGMAALAIDLGRMYVAHSEAQSFADAAALRATLRLASATPPPFDQAVADAESTPKQWEFGTKPFVASDVTAVFGPTQNGPWKDAASAGAGDVFVRVTARLNMPFYLLGVLGGISATGSTLSAAAVAGLSGDLSTGGEFPTSPISRIPDKNNPSKYSPDDATDPFGYQKNGEYTLRWGAKDGKTYTECGTDADSGIAEVKDENNAGWCCTGTSNKPDLEDAIIGTRPTVPLRIGDDLPFVTGMKQSVMSTLRERVDADPSDSQYWLQYKDDADANHKRLVVVPVNDGTKVQGFALFLLYRSDDYSKGPASKDCVCGQYLGPYVQGSTAAPGTVNGLTGGLLHPRLYE